MGSCHAHFAGGEGNDAGQAGGVEQQQHHATRLNVRPRLCDVVESFAFSHALRSAGCVASVLVDRRKWRRCHLQVDRVVSS
jgi:hypothetical protein